MSNTASQKGQQVKQEAGSTYDDLKKGAKDAGNTVKQQANEAFNNDDVQQIKQKLSQAGHQANMRAGQYMQDGQREVRSLWDRYADFCQRRPLAASFVTIQVILGFLPVATFLAFAAGASLVVGLTAAFFLGTALFFAGTVLLFTLGITSIIGLFVFGWFAAAYALMTWMAAVRNEASVIDGTRSWLSRVDHEAGNAAVNARQRIGDWQSKLQGQLENGADAVKGQADRASKAA